MAEEHRENNYVNYVRSSRQIRPILGSIIFLLAANLVAKGALALDTNYVPTLSNNIQGSLYLTLNGGKPPNSQTVGYQPTWFPAYNQQPYTSEQSTSRPISQQQIISIGEPLLTEESKGGIEDYKEPPYHIVIYKSQHDTVAEASENNPVTEKIEMDEVNEEISTTTETVHSEVDMIEVDKPSREELGRQAVTMNMMGTSMPTAMTMMTTRPFPITTTPAMNSTTSGMNLTDLPDTTNTTGNDTGYYYGYGYYGSNITDINITYGPPTEMNQTANVSEYLKPPNYTYSTYGPPHVGMDYGYKYYPAGNYGPSNGYEHVSITQKPFVFSPIDPYLDNQNNYQNNLYNPFYFNQFPYGYKYGSFNKYYTKDGWSYPFFYK